MKINETKLVKGESLLLHNDDILQLGNREFVLRNPPKPTSKKKRPPLRHTMLSRARILSSFSEPRPQCHRKSKSVGMPVGLQWWSKRLNRRPSLGSQKTRSRRGSRRSSVDVAKRKARSLKEMKVS